MIDTTIIFSTLGVSFLTGMAVYALSKTKRSVPITENVNSAVFQNTIRTLTNRCGWSLKKLTKQAASLELKMDGDSVQPVFMIDYDGLVEFSVPSIARFEEEENIPDFLSTALIKANAGRKIGFWCIEKIDGKHVFSVMHNEPLKKLDPSTFKEIIQGLAQECENLDNILKRTLQAFL